MKKKKGFTLIELLAIIVILAVIAVITVPIILGIVDEAKMKSAKDSAYGYKEAVSTLYASKILSNPSYSLEDRTYTVSELDTAGLSISGAVPESNSWINIENNQLVSACLQFGDYKVTIIDGKIGSVVKGECKPLYGYSVYSYGYLPDYPELTLSMDRPTEYTSYLRYTLVDGEVAPGTVPEACVYNENRGELCIRNKDYSNSVQKIKDYFGFTTAGPDAWISYEVYSLYDPNDWSVHCTIHDTDIYCADDDYYIGASVYSSESTSNLYVDMASTNGVYWYDDYDYSFQCRVYGDDSVSCF